MLPRSSSWAVAAALLALVASACRTSREPTLSKQTPSTATRSVPKVSETGPRLGSIANVTPVLEQPSADAKIIGYLHAGASVPRAKEPYSHEDCPEGWYPIHPRGFVCAGEGASLNLQHPTLLALAVQPQLNADLPYTYARTRQDTPALEASSQAQARVRALPDLPSRSGMAIVGSWNAQDDQGRALRLAMMTDGRFVDAEHLQESVPSAFRGVAVNDEQKLPVAFVVKRGVHSWKLDAKATRQARELPYHTVISLDGKVRNVGGERFWLSTDQDWVRNRDVTVVQKRSDFPQFVSGDSRWIDVSVLTGTAVLYEGKKPVYATLVSVGQDRLGDPMGSATTKRGEFPIVFKHISTVAADPKRFGSKVELHDVPWALELASGQWLHGAYWHDRFGIEHGPGNIQMSPADAAHVWRWVAPEVPAGWHGVTADGTQTIVNVRK